MGKIVYVGFGEYKVSADPDAILTCLGLGSCVAVVVYCPVSKAGGMIHTVLPSADGKPTLTPAKFADTGIKLLLDAILRQGGAREELIVKMAGGAEILKHHAMSRYLEIGKRNAETCKVMLEKLNLKLNGQEIGGNKGRSVMLHIGTGKVFIRTKQGEREF